MTDKIAEEWGTKVSPQVEILVDLNWRIMRLLRADDKEGIQNMIDLIELFREVYPDAARDVDGMTKK